MRKILLNRMADIQTELAKLKKSRNVLHPCSDGAKKFSIQIFEYEARLNELTYLLNVSNEN